jgi:hypothetical protein
MDVAIRSKISVEILKQASVMLLEKGLLKEIE